MIKSELRKLYLSKRKSLTPEERRNKSERIAASFFENFDLTKIKFLHCFISIVRTNEIDTRPVFEKVWRDFSEIETVVPRVNGKIGELESLKFSAETILEKNSWGIYEPSGTDLVEPEKIDAVLVPLLCFDKKGFRVGYGKGFYDKFLKECRTDCKKIGLSYFEPIEEISDVHDFDVPLDYCLTSESLWRF